MWAESTHPFSKVSNRTVAVWKLINNYILHVIADVITCPCWDQIDSFRSGLSLTSNGLASTSKVSDRYQIEVDAESLLCVTK